MELKRIERWYNPFCIDGDTKKELNNIFIYDDSGIIASTGRGWFNHKYSSNNILESIHFDFDCSRKLKPKFDKKVCYYIKVKDGKKSYCQLYIHKDLLKQFTSRKGTNGSLKGDYIYFLTDFVQYIYEIETDKYVPTKLRTYFESMYNIEVV